MRRVVALVALLALGGCKKTSPVVDASSSVAAYLQVPDTGCVVGGAPVYPSVDALEKQMKLSLDAHDSDEYTESLFKLTREPCGTRVLRLTQRTFSYKSTTTTYDEIELVDGAEKGKRLFVLDEAVHVGSPPASADAAAAAPTDAGQPKTAKDLANDHRDEMEKAANDGRYADVCSGTPTFPSAICAWVAAKAHGDTAPKPDWTVFVTFINREHIKKVNGRIVGDGDGANEYEVVVYGYRRHCILTTWGTTFTTKGAFSMWVQELPAAREVTTSSGGTENWVELEENELGKDLSDLTFAHGVEATALAKDIMTAIAKFVPYAELRGEVPDASAPLPPASTGTAAPPPTPTTGTAATTSARAAPTQTGADQDSKAHARADCLRTCVAKCSDDSACELDCATKKCPK